jgi:hypothetical protein
VAAISTITAIRMNSGTDLALAALPFVVVAGLFVLLR